MTSFNSQPREGGWVIGSIKLTVNCVSTHSRAKAAGTNSIFNVWVVWFQLTAARRRLVKPQKALPLLLVFQLTAARRRLGGRQIGLSNRGGVSTHSRAKAAGGACFVC